MWLQINGPGSTDRAMGTRIGTAAFCILLLSFGSGSVLAQDKALLVSADSTSYRIKLLAGIFLPFTKSCSAKVTLPSEEVIWAQVPRDDPVIRIPKSKVAASDEIKISGGNHEYNGKNVLACIMLPAKLTLNQALAAGTADATEKSNNHQPASAEDSTAQTGLTPDAIVKAAPEPEVPRLTLAEAQAIHEEMESQYLTVPVSDEQMWELRDLAKKGEKWHHLVIQLAQEGTWGGTSKNTATSPAVKPGYTISKADQKKYFDAILNQFQSGPWALAAAANGCHWYRQTMREWNSKWSAVRACNKACGTDDCKVIYVNRTQQSVKGGSSSTKAVAQAGQANFPDKTKVIFVSESGWPEGKIIFYETGEVLTWFDRNVSFFRDTKTDRAYFKNKGSGLHLLPGGYPAFRAWAPEGDWISVIDMKTGDEKKFGAGDFRWEAYQLSDLEVVRFLNSGRWFLTKSSLWFFDGEYLLRFRPRGEALCPRKGTQPVITSVSKRLFDGYCAKIPLSEKLGALPDEPDVELFSSAGDRSLPDAKLLDGMKKLYDAVALFSAGFTSAAVQLADEAAPLGETLDHDYVGKLINAASPTLLARFPYFAARLRLARLRNPSLPVGVKLNNFTGYIQSALAAGQHALALEGAERGRAEAAMLCPPLKSSGKSDDWKRCNDAELYLGLWALVAKLEGGAISEDEFWNTLIVLDKAVAPRLENLLWSPEYETVGHVIRSNTKKLWFACQHFGGICLKTESRTADEIKKRRQDLLQAEQAGFSLLSPFLDLEGQFYPAPAAPVAASTPNSTTSPATTTAITPSLIATTSETLQIGGGTYIGDVVDGRANGQGTLTWPNGSKYVGEFKDSKHHGQGTYTFPDGYKYVGEWKDGKQHGQGTYTTAGGNKYVGEKTDGKKHGQGTYTFADGRKYVGEWKDSKKHGQGTYTYADGQKYVGEWKDGYRHGKGTYTFADGRKYVGEFKNEKPWEGVSYLASGEIAATFSNGEVCRDCTPTAEQLAIVGEISATPITTPLAQPVGAQDKALSGDASPVIATLEELQDELEMAEKIELANELARGGAKNNDYSEQNKTASTPLTDPFLLAQSSYQVYKHTNDNDALSLAFASIHIAMEADQDNYKVFFLAGLIANEMPNKIIASQLAAVYFERASMLNLNDAPLHYIIAQNLYTKNRARESLEYFERALLLENRFLTPEYILVLSHAYIQAGQASRGATFFDAYRKNRSNLRLPGYLISTAAYLEFADQIRIILADASYSIKDKERAMKMLEGASH